MSTRKAKANTTPATRHLVPARGGGTVYVNASDMVARRCMNCHETDTSRLCVAFIARIPPAGCAYWVCEGGCHG